MPRTRRTPLAWKNLTHDVRRLLLALGGIGFAVLLMCMQLSFRDALFDSTVALIRRLNADLVIISQARYTIVVREPFSLRRLYQALACPGVEAARPLYIETQLSLLRKLEAAEGQPIRVLAFDPEQPVLEMPAVAKYAKQLRLPFNVLFDRKSKAEFGAIGPESELELAGTRVRVLDTFELGTDFANDGNLITSALNYRRLFGQPGLGDVLADVDVGVVKVKPGYDLDEVRRNLAELLPSDVNVLTKPEFESLERRFWATSTPIGYIFTLGTLMGFIVGVVICYQILYTDIADHMPEFATLKAMGYQNRYFIGVVLQEAVLLSLMGFVPGVLVSQLLCWMVAERTGLLVQVGLSVAIIVLVLSLVMCVVSGCLTMRKVLSADPAELF